MSYVQSSICLMAVFNLSFPVDVFFFYYSLLVYHLPHCPIPFTISLFSLFLSHFFSSYDPTPPCIHCHLLPVMGLLILNACWFGAAGQTAAVLWWQPRATKLNGADKNHPSAAHEYETDCLGGLLHPPDIHMRRYDTFERQYVADVNTVEHIFARVLTWFWYTSLKSVCRHSICLYDDICMNTVLTRCMLITTIGSK